MARDLHSAPCVCALAALRSGGGGLFTDETMTAAKTHPANSGSSLQRWILACLSPTGQPAHRLSGLIPRAKPRRSARGRAAARKRFAQVIGVSLRFSRSQWNALAAMSLSRTLLTASIRQVYQQPICQQARRGLRIVCSGCRQCRIPGSLPTHSRCVWPGDRRCRIRIHPHPGRFRLRKIAHDRRALGHRLLDHLAPRSAARHMEHLSCQIHSDARHYVRGLLSPAWMVRGIPSWRTRTPI
jgi:hypothetical protein